MSLLVPQRTTGKATTVTRRRRVPQTSMYRVPEPKTSPYVEEAIGVERLSDKTGVVFQVLLGIAACLALTGVLSQQPSVSSSSPDAPAPAVFIELD